MLGGLTSGFSSFLGRGGGDSGGVEEVGRLTTAFCSAASTLTVCSDGEEDEEEAGGVWVHLDSNTTLTLGSGVRLLIWMGGPGGGGAGSGVGLPGSWAGQARRAGAAETGVVMTMPVRGAEPALPQGWPLTMRTWWMGAEDGSEADSLVVNMTGLCSSWGAAIMGGGGAGAMGTLVGVASLGLTC